MAPSSPSSAAPTRVSGRKRAAKAEEIHQNQEEEEEEEVTAVSSAKCSRKVASSVKKPMSTPKQAKPGRKKKGDAEMKEPVEDDVCAEEPDEEELAMREEESEEQTMRRRWLQSRRGHPGRRGWGEGTPPPPPATMSRSSSAAVLPRTRHAATGPSATAASLFDSCK
jgi:DNA (cytosine-5)-methyltransferase 1